MARKVTRERKRSVKLFRDLTDSEVRKITKAGLSHWFAEGTTIFTKGDTGEDIYAILSGKVTIIDPSAGEAKALAVLRDGGVFGELSVDIHPERSARARARTRTYRTASAIASKDTEVLQLNEETLQQFQKKNAKIASTLLFNLMKTVGRRLRRNVKRSGEMGGADVPDMLHNLTTGERKRLLKFGMVKVYRKGKRIFKRGDKGEELYHVLSGSVTIYRTSEGTRKSLATLYEGDLFGELGMISGRGRLASARAASETELLEISLEGLHKLRSKHPDVASKLLLNLFNILRERLRTTAPA